MSKDKNFERRMIVSKYSNRPPFDLKKPKENMDIMDKIREYPADACKSCCRNRTKNYKDTTTKASKHFIREEVEHNNVDPGKRVIPKIMETFQKINPHQDLQELNMNKKASIQTLYRNTRNCKLGKNIPKHKLMKSLLQNLDSEGDSSKRCSGEFYLSKNASLSSKGRHKKISSKKQFFSKGEIIRPDFDIICERKKYPNQPIYVNCTQNNKLDKNTSTTGLVWPPKPKEILHYHDALYTHKINKNSLEQISENRERDLKNSKHFVSGSNLKEKPKRNLPQNQNAPQPIRSEKYLKRNVEFNNQRKKSLEDSTFHKKQTNKKIVISNIRLDKYDKRSDSQLMKAPSEKLKQKEKSFVQTQVEKLNRVMRNTKIPCPILTRPQNYNDIQGMHRRDAKECIFTGGGDNLRKKEESVNYFGLMDRIRNQVPRIEKSERYESVESSTDHGWSDSTVPEIYPKLIRFPRETKAAMDQHLGERRMRIPLSKFTILHDKNFRPAIPHKKEEGVNCKDTYEKHNRAFPPEEKARQKHNPNTKKSGPLPGKAVPNIPCKRNLLCDKGERHSGPCGHAHGRNKVVY